MSLRARLLLLVTLATLVPAVLLGIRFFQRCLFVTNHQILSIGFKSAEFAGK